jgi:hypothetical protein
MVMMRRRLVTSSSAHFEADELQLVQSEVERLRTVNIKEDDFVKVSHRTTHHHLGRQVTLVHLVKRN